jgi:hypothetical protein
MKGDAVNYCCHIIVLVWTSQMHEVLPLYNYILYSIHVRTLRVFSNDRNEWKKRKKKGTNQGISKWSLTAMHSIFQYIVYCSHVLDLCLVW